jgi:multidrug efflux system outer membrane protein
MKRLIQNCLNFFLILGAFSACSLEPKYRRPQSPVSLLQSETKKQKITTITWQEFFQSAELQKVIQLALENNRDLRIANLNIESAQANYGVVRSDLLPTISALGYETRQKAASSFSSFTPKRQYRANFSLTSYEIDFFGRLRSLKKAALESFLATRQAKNVTKISLIASTVNAYAQFLLDDEILKISAKNLEVQEERYRFFELRYKNGISLQTDLLNASALLENAKANYETYKKLVAQDKSALMLLTGSFKEEDFSKNTTLNDIKINENLLDLIPSESLLSRPDIQQAENSLKSANANIGAVRAAFFPSITLTGSYGYGSRDLDTLFNSRTWTFTPQINLPIFTGGKNIEDLKIANLRKKVEIATYEKAVQTAFSEVLDQLAERQSATKRVKSFDNILKVQKKSYEIAEEKHREGINSGLDVLDSKITLLLAEQDQATAKKDYITNLVNLYKVLGGGSEIEESES